MLRIRGRKIGLLWPVALLLFVSAVNPAAAQNNYEIQVYGSDTVAPNTTMLELHSNFTVDGSKPLPGSVYAADQLYPTNHAEHETLEITQGINNWSEVGFYVFTSARSGQGWQWVGDHIRPRVRVPDSWHWPVGVSFRLRSAISGATFRLIHGRGRSGPSSISRSDDGISPSILRSNDRFMGRPYRRELDFHRMPKFSYDFTSTYRRPRILCGLRKSAATFTRFPQSAAAVFSGDRSECLAQLGD